MRKKKLIEENATLKASLTAMSYKAAELDKKLRDANNTINWMILDLEDQSEHAYFNGVGAATRRLKKELADAKQDLREMTQDRDILVNTEARLEQKIGELMEKLVLQEQERESLARRLERHENPTMKQFLEVEDERRSLRKTQWFKEESKMEAVRLARKMREAGEPSVVAETCEKIAMEREKIIEAFIVQHGCLPDECEQVIENTTTGTKWYVRKKAGASEAQKPA